MAGPLAASRRPEPSRKPLKPVRKRTKRKHQKLERKLSQLRNERQKNRADFAKSRLPQRGWRLIFIAVTISQNWISCFVTRS